MLSRLGKIIIQICLMGLLLFAVAAGAEGKIEAVHEGPVVLKMNDYYIIYTYPKGPYINEDHRLVMPLRSVSDLIGASVAYDGSAGTATVALDNDTVQFTVGSRVVMKNGKPLEMDTVPIIDEGHMFIPLRILFESFDFKVDINEYGIV